MSSVKKRTGHRADNGVSATSDLKDGEYQEVKDHISNSLGKWVQKKRPGTPQPESEDKKRRREANSQRANSMRKCKALIYNTTNEMATLEAELPKLATRGYPEEMQEWCKSNLRKMNVHIKEAQAAYTTEIVTVASTATTEDLIGDHKRMDEAYQDLDTAFSAWKKSSGNEVKKIIS